MVSLLLFEPDQGFPNIFFAVKMEGVIHFVPHPLSLSLLDSDSKVGLYFLNKGSVPEISPCQ